MQNNELFRTTEQRKQKNSYVCHDQSERTTQASHSELQKNLNAAMYLHFDPPFYDDEMLRQFMEVAGMNRGL